MTKKIVLTCFSFLIIFVSLSYAEVFYLKDGTIAEGTIIEENKKGVTLKDATIRSKSPADPNQEYPLLASRYFVRKDEIEKTEESKEHPSLELSSGDATMTKEEAMRKSTDLFEKAAEKLPSNPYSWIALGMAYREQNNYAKAVENFKKAIEIDNNLFDGHYYLASLYLKMGNRQEAKKEYEKTLLLVDSRIKKLEARGGNSGMLKRFREIKEECNLVLSDIENSTDYFLKKRILQENDGNARANIRYFTQASEFYKSRKDEYAKSISDLLVYSKSPFVIKLQDSRHIDGFEYCIEFQAEGYKIIGTPLECNKSGSKIFVGETGDRYVEKECIDGG